MVNGHETSFRATVARARASRRGEALGARVRPSTTPLSAPWRPDTPAGLVATRDAGYTTGRYEHLFFRQIFGTSHGAHDQQPGRGRARLPNDQASGHRGASVQHHQAGGLRDPAQARERVLRRGLRGDAPARSPGKEADLRDEADLDGPLAQGPGGGHQRVPRPRQAQPRACRQVSRILRRVGQQAVHRDGIRSQGDGAFAGAGRQAQDAVGGCRVATHAAIRAGAAPHTRPQDSAQGHQG